MLHYYIEALSKYFTFSGRSRRKEYWSFMAVNFIVGMALGFLDGLTGVTALGYIAAIYQLLMLIPGISLFVRRLHDTGRSGWHFFIPLVLSVMMLGVTGIAYYASTSLEHGVYWSGLYIVSVALYITALCYPIYIGVIDSKDTNRWGAPANQF